MLLLKKLLNDWTLINIEILWLYIYMIDIVILFELLIMCMTTCM